MEQKSRSSIEILIEIYNIIYNNISDKDTRTKLYDLVCEFDSSSRMEVIKLFSKSKA